LGVHRPVPRLPRRKLRGARVSQCSSGRNANASADAAASENPPATASAALHPPEPFVDVAFNLVPGVAVAGLDLPLELFAIAVDLGEIIVRQLSPFLLHLADDLPPIAMYPIPVHDDLSSCDAFWRLRLRRRDFRGRCA